MYNRRASTIAVPTTSSLAAFFSDMPVHTVYVYLFPFLLFSISSEDAKNHAAEYD